MLITNIIPCSNCKESSVSIILTIVNSCIEYVDEAYTFTDGYIINTNDFNPIIVIVRWNNCHQFEIRGVIPCKCCGLERIIAKKSSGKERNGLPLITLDIKSIQ